MLLFSRYRRGQLADGHPCTAASIYVANVVTGQDRRLTRGPRDEGGTWSPDGRMVAFVRRGVREESRANVFVIRDDGRGARQLVRGAGQSSSPTWSADGRRIALVAEGPRLARGLYVARRDGSRLRLLLRTRATQMITGAAWSPNGRLIAVEIVDERTEHVYALPTGGGVARFLTGGFRSKWAPDSGRIAVDLGCDIHIVTIDDPQPREPGACIPERYRRGSPSWAPDGKRLAFAGCRLGCHVEVADATAWPPQTSRVVACCLLPLWSPDGRWIATHADGRIYLVTPDGSRARPLLR